MKTPKTSKPLKPAVRCTGWLGDVKAALRLLENARMAGEKRLSIQEWNRLLNAEIAIDEVIESQRRRSPSGGASRQNPPNQHSLHE